MPHWNQETAILTKVETVMKMKTKMAVKMKI